MGKFNMEKLNQNGLGHLWDEIKLSIYNDCKKNIGRRMVKFVKQCMNSTLWRGWLILRWADNFLSRPSG